MEKLKFIEIAKLTLLAKLMICLQVPVSAFGTDAIRPGASPQGTPGSVQAAQYVSSNRYNIRNQNGERLCSIPRGVPLAPNAVTKGGDWVHVTLNVRGCPKQGWISVNGLQPVGGSSQVEVDVDGALAFRAQPAGKFQCALPRGSKMTVVGSMPQNHQYRAWVKVKLSETVSGCPSTGWVHREYVRPAKELMSEIRTDDSSDAAESAASSQESSCENCPAKDRIDEIKAVSAGRKSYDEITTWRKNRGLVQIPVRGSRGNIGPCGSHHYSPDVSNGRVVDNYANPTTACVMMSVLQDWKKHYCPGDSAGCRVAWGDISHVTRAKFNGHRSHTDGYCIDIRPMRVGDFQDAPLHYTQRGYDRRATTAFITLLKKKGASTIYFNDSRAGGKYSGGHDNHIHVCFTENKKTRAVCENYKYDARVCGAQ